MNVTLKVEKAGVYEEVAQTTSYTGAKMMDGDAKAYDRIFTTDEDASQLERFWNESCAGAVEALKKYVAEESSDTTAFEVKLEVSSAFDSSLLPSIRKELFSYFVMSITGKWYAFTNKGESGAYLASAGESLEGVKRKVCYKKRPKRPTYGTNLPYEPVGPVKPPTGTAEEKN